MRPRLQALDDDMKGLLNSIASGSGIEATAALWKAHRAVIGVSCLATPLVIALEMLTVATLPLNQLCAYPFCLIMAMCLFRALTHQLSPEG